jgi:hypothetical protein
MEQLSSKSQKKARLIMLSSKKTSQVVSFPLKRVHLKLTCAPLQYNNKKKYKIKIMWSIA